MKKLRSLNLEKICAKNFLVISSILHKVCPTVIIIFLVEIQMIQFFYTFYATYKKIITIFLN